MSISVQLSTEIRMTQGVSHTCISELIKTFLKIVIFWMHCDEILSVTFHYFLVFQHVHHTYENMTKKQKGILVLAGFKKTCIYPLILMLAECQQSLTCSATIRGMHANVWLYLLIVNTFFQIIQGIHTTWTLITREYFLKVLNVN